MTTMCHTLSEATFLTGLGLIGFSMRIVVLRLRARDGERIRRELAESKRSRTSEKLRVYSLGATACLPNW